MIPVRWKAQVTPIKLSLKPQLLSHQLQSTSDGRLVPVLREFSLKGRMTGHSLADLAVTFSWFRVKRLTRGVILTQGVILISILSMRGTLPREIAAKSHARLQIRQASCLSPHIRLQHACYPMWHHAPLSARRRGAHSSLKLRCSKSFQPLSLSQLRVRRQPW